MIGLILNDDRKLKNNFEINYNNIQSSLDNLLKNNTLDA